MASLLELFGLKPKTNETSQADADQQALLEAKQQEAYEARFKARVVQVMHGLLAATPRWIGEADACPLYLSGLLITGGGTEGEEV